MSIQISADAAPRGNHEDSSHDEFLERINARFLANCENGKKPMFTTDAEGLWDLYLDSFSDPSDRQHHNCRSCRNFIERYGSLVTIGEGGTTSPAIWDESDATDEYRAAFAALSRAVRRAKVTGVFLSSDPVWGTPATGVWHHMAVRPAKEMLHKSLVSTAGQAMAAKKEDFRTVTHALGEFTLAHLETALTLLKSDSLYRSEKVLGQAEWLHSLHIARSAAHGNLKANVVWRAIAIAPAGFCHPRSSMIGTLLEDIAAGKGYEEVSRAFAAKMHPLQYQRPQSAPTSGAIAAAEKLFEKLGAAGSLARRFCRVDEVHALWRPAPKKEEKTSGGLFGHLKAKDEAVAPAMAVPAQTMTWVKFRDEVLPTAEKIGFRAPSIGPYTAFVTAANMDAPPILQWDREDARNPVSWYVWRGGSPARQFGLVGGMFHDVDAVSLTPSMWGGGQDHHGAGVVFLIAGARESRKDTGLALFPEILKSEFHGSRSVVEAHSKSGEIEGMDDPHAAGVLLQKGSRWDAMVRVWVGGRSLDYKLDRWD
jgi:hypothetical protein